MSVLADIQPAALVRYIHKQATSKLHEKKLLFRSQSHTTSHVTSLESRLAPQHAAPPRALFTSTHDARQNRRPISHRTSHRLKKAHYCKVDVAFIRTTTASVPMDVDDATEADVTPVDAFGAREATGAAASSPVTAARGSVASAAAAAALAASAKSVMFTPAEVSTPPRPTGRGGGGEAVGGGGGDVLEQNGQERHLQREQ